MFPFIQTQPGSLALSTDSERPDQLAVEFAKLDLSSLQSTMDFIQGVKQRSSSLHVLVCNAGIAFVKEGKTIKLVNPMHSALYIYNIFDKAPINF